MGRSVVCPSISGVLEFQVLWLGLGVAAMPLQKGLTFEALGYIEGK